MKVNKLIEDLRTGAKIKSNIEFLDFFLHDGSEEATAFYGPPPQFFDFGCINDDQIIEESLSASQALYEGFLRLPAPNCVFEHSWYEDKVIKNQPLHSVYVFRTLDEGANIQGCEFIYTKHPNFSNTFSHNGLVLSLAVLTPESQTAFNLNKQYMTQVVQNQTNLDLKENDGFATNLFEPMICMLGRLNARGIEQKYVPAPEKLNKARIKRKKAPLVSYTTVKVSPYRAPLGHSGARDEVTSPRYHFRRGHIRRFPNGGKTWVRDCFVGCPEEGGRVEHTYQVEEMT